MAKNLICYYLSMDFWGRIKHHFIPSEENVYRPHILRKPWLIFFLAIILTAEGVFVFDLVARQSALDYLAAVLSGEVVALTNVERAQAQVRQLSENTALTMAAQAKAEDMAAKGYFSHVGPDGTEPWEWVRAAGYDYRYAGENLAVRFNASSDVVNAWMASPSHKANMVKPVYTEIGVGVAEGIFQGQPATYVVQYFGTPRSVALAQQPLVASQHAAAVPEASADVSPQEGQGSVAAVETLDVGAPAPTLAPQQTPWSSLAQKLLRQETQTSSPVSWVLSGVAALLVLALALAFFVRIQIQAADMLMSGAVVAAVAIALLTLNSYVPASFNNSQQAAAVFGAVPQEGGFISSSAAQTSSSVQQ